MTYPRMDISDMDIQALVDQQLDWEDEKAVRSFINSNISAESRYQELLKQKKLLRKWWQGLQTRH